MKVPSRAMSRPSSIVCPVCGCGELRTRGPDVAECASCGHAFEGAVLRTLEEITSLPDGVFHCPACGSEVVPLDADSTHTTLVGNPHRKEKTLWPTNR